MKIEEIHFDNKIIYKSFLPKNLNNILQSKKIQSICTKFFRKYNKKESNIIRGFSSQIIENNNILYEYSIIKKTEKILLQLFYNFFYKYLTEKYYHTCFFINYYLSNSRLKEHKDQHHHLALLYYPYIEEGHGDLYILSDDLKEKKIIELETNLILIIPTNIIHGSNIINKEGRVTFVNFFKKKEAND